MTTTAAASAAKTSSTQSDVHHQPDRGLRRHPPRARTGQRAQPHLRARLARARRAQGAAGVDGGGEDRDPARDRRQGDSHRHDRESRDAARPPARAGRVSPGRPGARPAGDRRRRRSAPRVGGLAVGRPRRRRAARRRAARHVLAPDDQRRDDARPVEDGVPGRDRRRLGDDRLLALQHLLRAGALRRAAGQRPRRVELDGVPPARGLHLRRLAVQLHRDRRQPDDRAGADGQHRHLEAGLVGDAERLLHAQAARGRRAAAGRHQLPARRRRGDHQRAARFAGAGRHPLHRQHRRLQQHVEEGRREHRPLQDHIRAWSAKPAARTSSSSTRPPIRRKSRWRSRAAASSTRARSARPRAASTCRSRCGTRSAIAPSRS